MRIALSLTLGLALLAGCAETTASSDQNFLVAPRAPATVAAPAQTEVAMRWSHKSGSDRWTDATLRALDQHGVTMLSQVPSDINAYCPGYAAQGTDGRRAFWAGLMSALAKHESTYNPAAKGGGGKWLGLMQIAPATWRHYGCSGEMLNGADNMSCAVKILARQVGRDNAVAGGKGGWRGVARDWAPMRNAKKRGDIAAWTSQQSYCSGARQG